MKASRNRSISAGILIAFCFGILVSGGFVSRGWNQTPIQKDDKSKNRFEDDRSSGELVIDATLRELSRHWLECYFNKTAKYDSVHVQARRIFSFETYDVSESDRKRLEETTQEYIKNKRVSRILTEHHADGSKERQALNSDFNVREDQSGNGEGASQNMENASETRKEHKKPEQHSKNSGFQKIRKRMRRDVTESVLVREGIMKITDGVEWTDDFLNKTSEAYQQLEEMVLAVIDSLFQNSPIASYFYGSFINDFKQGSVIVLFSIEFKNDTNITHTDESINEAFHEALLNASAFTNLTLDVNSSKIGSVKSETTTILATTGSTGNSTEITTKIDDINTTPTQLEDTDTTMGTTTETEVITTSHTELADITTTILSTTDSGDTNTIMGTTTETVNTTNPHTQLSDTSTSIVSTTETGDTSTTMDTANETNDKTTTNTVTTTTIVSQTDTDDTAATTPTELADTTITIGTTTELEDTTTAPTESADTTKAIVTTTESGVTTAATHTESADTTTTIVTDTDTGKTIISTPTESVNTITTTESGVTTVATPTESVNTTIVTETKTGETTTFTPAESADNTTEIGTTSEIRDTTTAFHELADTTATIGATTKIDETTAATSAELSDTNNTIVTTTETVDTTNASTKLADTTIVTTTEKEDTTVTPTELAYTTTTVGSPAELINSYTITTLEDTPFPTKTIDTTTPKDITTETANTAAIVQTGDLTTTTKNRVTATTAQTENSATTSKVQGTASTSQTNDIDTITSTQIDNTVTPIKLDNTTTEKWDTDTTTKIKTSVTTSITEQTTSTGIDDTTIITTSRKDDTPSTIQLDTTTKSGNTATTTNAQDTTTATTNTLDVATTIQTKDAATTQTEETVPSTIMFDAATTNQNGETATTKGDITITTQVQDTTTTLKTDGTAITTITDDTANTTQAGDTVTTTEARDTTTTTQAGDIVTTPQAVDTATTTQTMDVATTIQTVDMTSVTQAIDSASTIQTTDPTSTVQIVDAATKTQSADMTTTTKTTQFTTQTMDITTTTQTFDAATTTQTVDTAITTQTADATNKNHAVDMATTTKIADTEFTTKTMDIPTTTQTFDAASTTQTVDAAITTQTVNAANTTQAVDTTSATETADAATTTRTEDMATTTQTASMGTTNQTVDKAPTTKTADTEFTTKTMDTSKTTQNFDAASTTQTVDDAITTQTVNAANTTQAVDTTSTTESTDAAKTSQTVDTATTTRTEDMATTTQTASMGTTIQTVDKASTTKTTDTATTTQIADTVTTPQTQTANMATTTNIANIATTTQPMNTATSTETTDTATTTQTIDTATTTQSVDMATTTQIANVTTKNQAADTASTTKTTDTPSTTQAVDAATTTQIVEMASSSPTVNITTTTLTVDLTSTTQNADTSTINKAGATTIQAVDAAATTQTGDIITHKESVDTSTPIGSTTGTATLAGDTVTTTETRESFVTTGFSTETGEETTATQTVDFSSMISKITESADTTITTESASSNEQTTTDMVFSMETTMQQSTESSATTKTSLNGDLTTTSQSTESSYTLSSNGHSTSTLQTSQNVDQTTKPSTESSSASFSEKHFPSTMQTYQNVDTTTATQQFTEPSTASSSKEQSTSTLQTSQNVEKTTKPQFTESSSTPSSEEHSTSTLQMSQNVVSTTTTTQQPTEPLSTSSSEEQSISTLETSKNVDETTKQQPTESSTSSSEEHFTNTMQTSQSVDMTTTIQESTESSPTSSSDEQSTTTVQTSQNVDATTTPQSTTEPSTTFSSEEQFTSTIQTSQNLDTTTTQQTTEFLSTPSSKDQSSSSIQTSQNVDTTLQQSYQSTSRLLSEIQSTTMIQTSPNIDSTTLSQQPSGTTTEQHSGFLSTMSTDDQSTYTVQTSSDIITTIKPKESTLSSEDQTTNTVSIQSSPSTLLSEDQTTTSKQTSHSTDATTTQHSIEGTTTGQTIKSTSPLSTNDISTSTKQAEEEITSTFTSEVHSTDIVTASPNIDTITIEQPTELSSASQSTAPSQTSPNIENTTPNQSTECLSSLSSEVQSTSPLQTAPDIEMATPTKLIETSSTLSSENQSTTTKQTFPDIDTTIAENPTEFLSTLSSEVPSTVTIQTSSTLDMTTVQPAKTSSTLSHDDQSTITKQTSPIIDITISQQPTELSSDIQSITTTQSSPDIDTSTANQITEATAREHHTESSSEDQSSTSKQTSASINSTSIQNPTESLTTLSPETQSITMIQTSPNIDTTKQQQSESPSTFLPEVQSTTTSQTDMTTTQHSTGASTSLSSEDQSTILPQTSPKINTITVQTPPESPSTLSPDDEIITTMKNSQIFDTTTQQGKESSSLLSTEVQYTSTSGPFSRIDTSNTQQTTDSSSVISSITTTESPTTHPSEENKAGLTSNTLQTSEKDNTITTAQPTSSFTEDKTSLTSQSSFHFDSAGTEPYTKFLPTTPAEEQTTRSVQISQDTTTLPITSSEEHATTTTPTTTYIDPTSTEQPAEPSSASLKEDESTSFKATSPITDLGGSSTITTISQSTSSVETEITTEESLIHTSTEMSLSSSTLHPLDGTVDSIQTTQPTMSKEVSSTDLLTHKTAETTALTTSTENSTNLTQTQASTSSSESPPTVSSTLMEFKTTSLSNESSSMTSTSATTDLPTTLMESSTKVSSTMIMTESASQNEMSSTTVSTDSNTISNSTPELSSSESTATSGELLQTTSNKPTTALLESSSIVSSSKTPSTITSTESTSESTLEQSQTTQTPINKQDLTSTTEIPSDTNDILTIEITRVPVTGMQSTVISTKLPELISAKSNTVTSQSSITTTTQPTSTALVTDSTSVTISGYPSTPTREARETISTESTTQTHSTSLPSTAMPETASTDWFTPETVQSTTSEKSTITSEFGSPEHTITSEKSTTMFSERSTTKPIRTTSTPATTSEATRNETTNISQLETSTSTEQRTPINTETNAISTESPATTSISEVEPAQTPTTKSRPSTEDFMSSTLTESTQSESSISYTGEIKSYSSTDNPTTPKSESTENFVSTTTRETPHSTQDASEGTTEILVYTTLSSTTTKFVPEEPKTTFLHAEQATTIPEEELPSTSTEFSTDTLKENLTSKLLTTLSATEQSTKAQSPSDTTDSFSTIKNSSPSSTILVSPTQSTINISTLDQIITTETPATSTQLLKNTEETSNIFTGYTPTGTKATDILTTETETRSNKTTKGISLEETSTYTSTTYDTSTKSENSGVSADEVTTFHIQSTISTMNESLDIASISTVAESSASTLTPMDASIDSTTEVSTSKATLSTTSTTTNSEGTTESTDIPSVEITNPMLDSTIKEESTLMSTTEVTKSVTWTSKQDHSISSSLSTVEISQKTDTETTSEISTIKSEEKTLSLSTTSGESMAPYSPSGGEELQSTNTPSKTEVNSLSTKTTQIMTAAATTGTTTENISSHSIENTSSSSSASSSVLFQLSTEPMMATEDSINTHSTENPSSSESPSLTMTSEASSTIYLTHNLPVSSSPSASTTEGNVRNISEITSEATLTTSTEDRSDTLESTTLGNIDKISSESLSPDTSKEKTTISFSTVVPTVSTKDKSTKRDLDFTTTSSSFSQGLLQSSSDLPIQNNSDPQTPITNTQNILSGVSTDGNPSTSPETSKESMETSSTSESSSQMTMTNDTFTSDRQDSTSPNVLSTTENSYILTTKSHTDSTLSGTSKISTVAKGTTADLMTPMEETAFSNTPSTHSSVTKPHVTTSTQEPTKTEGLSTSSTTGTENEGATSIATNIEDHISTASTERFASKESTTLSETISNDYSISNIESTEKMVTMSEASLSNTPGSTANSESSVRATITSVSTLNTDTFEVSSAVTEGTSTFKSLETKDTRTSTIQETTPTNEHMMTSTTEATVDSYTNIGKTSTLSSSIMSNTSPDLGSTTATKDTSTIPPISTVYSQTTSESTNDKGISSTLPSISDINVKTTFKSSVTTENIPMFSSSVTTRGTQESITILKETSTGVVSTSGIDPTLEIGEELSTLISSSTTSTYPLSSKQTSDTQDIVPSTTNGKEMIVTSTLKASVSDQYSTNPTEIQSGEWTTEVTEMERITTQPTEDSSFLKDSSSTAITDGSSSGESTTVKEEISTIPTSSDEETERTTSNNITNTESISIVSTETPESKVVTKSTITNSHTTTSEIEASKENTSDFLSVATKDGTTKAPLFKSTLESQSQSPLSTESTTGGLNSSTTPFDHTTQNNQSQYENDTTTVIISSTILSTTAANEAETTNGSQVLTTENSYTNTFETTSIRDSTTSKTAISSERTSDVPTTSTPDVIVTSELTSQTTNASTTALISTIRSTSNTPSTTSSTLHTTTIGSILTTVVGNILTTTTNVGKSTTLGVLPTTTTTTAPAVIADEEVSGVIKIEEEFDQALLDPNSDAYKKKVDEILKLLETLFSIADIAKYIGSIKIEGFIEGSLIVKFKVAFIIRYNTTNLKSQFNTAYYSIFEPGYKLKDEFTQFSDNGTFETIIGSAINNCLDVTCPQNATCKSLTDSYECLCRDGYVLIDNQCQDVDECLGYPCSNHFICKNTIGSYNCFCEEGFTLVGDSCEDIDECKIPDFCPLHSTCINFEGSYICACDDGFAKNDTSCSDVNECENNVCPEHSDCQNTEGSYTCDCQRGFSNSGGVCIDVNECLSNVCPDNSYCENTLGSYSCSCQSGFIKNGTQCQDIDECTSLHEPCMENSFCNNTKGSYICTCKPGYLDIGHSCKDINECNIGLCPSYSICKNTEGSYICSCIDGYQMENKTCIDVNECEDDVCPVHSVCANSAGSYTCSCDPGYTMTDRACEDIDECTRSLNVCPTVSTCINTNGSYFCKCKEGYFQSSSYSCAESSVYGIDLRIQKINGSEATYSVALNDSSTPEFQTLADSLKQITQVVVMESLISEGFLGSTFHKFEPGSIVSSGNMFYEPEVVLSYDDTEIFSYNSTSAYMENSIEISELNLTDVNECLDENWNDCSPNANCTNARGKYNCTCFPGYLDISEDPFKPGRLCVAISDQYKDTIQGLSVETNNTHYLVSENIIFTVRLSRGSHVTFNISYGDGSTEQIVYTNVLTFLSDTVFNYKYTTTGSYNVSVWAVNEISKATVTTIVDVVNDIKNLNLTYTSTDFSYNGQKRFELRAQETLNNVKISWDFGSGFEQATLMSLFSSSVPLTVDHYYEVGNKLVRVNVSNERTYQVIEKAFYIEEKLSGLDIDCSSNVTEPLKVSYLLVSFQNGSNVSLSISFGDGNKLQSDLKNYRRSSYSNYYPIVFSNSGSYNISVRVFNTYSEMTSSLTVYVETPIKDLILAAKSVVDLPAGKFKLLLSFTGNGFEPCCMTCKTYIKGMYQQSDTITLINKTNPVEINTVWPNKNDVGLADIEVMCKNRLGNQTLTTWTTFQRKIENVLLEVSPTSIVVGGAINVTFFIGVGSHIEYQYDLGNGVKNNVKISNSLVENYTVNVGNYYQLMGVYKVNLNVSNQVSTIIKTLDVKVLEEIKGLKLSRYYMTSDTKETIHKGHGSSNDIFPLERPVIFESSVSSGNEIVYIWKFGIENAYVTKDAKVTYKFKNTGSHLISVNASNGIFFAYKDFNITLQEIVNPYSLRNDGPKMAYELMTFLLKLSNPGTNPCYLWDMGDSPSFTIYGESYCEEKAKLNNYVYKPWNVSYEIRHQHMYSSNGTHNVKVSGFNLVSSQTIYDIGVITGANCFYPIVHIIGGGQRIDEPVNRFRSEWINLESSAEINCPASEGPEYHWKFFKITEGNNYLNRVFSSYNISTNATDNFKILFEPNTFQPGLYRISLNVSMKDIPGMFSEHYTYLNITKTPLVVRISGGTARNIGYDSQLILDAYQMTIDPDYVKSSNFTYEWRCRKDNEVYPSAINYITMPTLDEALNQTRRDGCFGTGIGKLPISSGFFEISTLLLEPHSINVFEVYVRKDTREGVFQQKVEVIDGDPPLIQIVCVENCNSKMNPSSSFSVQGKCLSCNLFEKVQFNWSLYVEHLEVFQIVPNFDSLLVTDKTSSVLVFKSSTLIGGRTYRLRLAANVYGYSGSFTEYEFITNLPPYGGTCGINPSSGYALETEFVISCYDWVNPGEEETKGAGLLYRFWSKLRGRQDTQLLYYGTDPYTPDTTFPLGPEESDFMHDVVIRIANPIGEYVETWLSVKVSKPVVKNDVNELITLTSGQDSTLNGLLSSGKTQEAKQVIVAVASLINTSPTEIGISRASIIKSVETVLTTTTTTLTTVVPFTSSLPADSTILAEYDNLTTFMPTVSSTTKKSTTGKVTTPITQSPTTTEHLSTYFVGTTLDPAVVEAERLRKEEEEKQKRIKLRESLLTTLSNETTSLTLDSLQQTALCFRVVTHESSELSETSQKLAVDAMSDVANSFQKIIRQSQTDSTVQTYSAAEDILACLSSVIIAATGEELAEIQKINEEDGSLGDEGSSDKVSTTTTTTTTTSSPSNGTTKSPVTTKSPEEVKLATKQRVRALASKVFNVAEVVYKTIIQDRVPGEPPVVLESQLFTMVAERLTVSDVNNTYLDTTTGSFQMPTMDSILSQNTSFVDSKVLSSKTNPYVWDYSAKYINTPVLTLNLYDNEGKEIEVKNLTDTITIDISVDSSKLEITQINFPLTSKETLSYHYFTVRSNMSSVHVVVRPEDPETKLECYLGIGRQPTLQSYDSNFTIPHELTYNVPDAVLKEELEHTIFLPPEFVQENGIGAYYLGVRPVYNETDDEEYFNYDDYYVDYGIVTPPDLLNYTISFVTSGCFYWDIHHEKWITNGCQISYLSNSNYTRCLCNHLTSFGSDFFVPPNTINFMTVFNDFEAKLRDNWAVLAVLSFMYLMYMIGLIWARFKDKMDVIKWGIAPLADNVVSDKFFYQLTVCTGMRRGAGTKSKVSFVLAGDSHDTGVRELIDEKGIKTCSRGSINNFVLSTSEWLGPLTFIRIWHDNTGNGKFQGWYLSKVIVTDLQTSETFCFLCNRWLAVEEDDGMIDRLLPVASKEDMTNFQNLFMTKTKKSFTDSHLWISVFSRPHRSTFTRVQRLSCILSLVMTTMMVNAMFYQAEDRVKNKEYISFGPFEFSLSGIYISFVSSLIVLPVNIIIDQLFRKSKPKVNRITNAFMGKNVQPLAALSHIKLRPWSPPDSTKLEDYVEKPLTRPDSANSTYSVHSESALIEKRKKSNEIAIISHPQTKPKKRKTKKFMLPHSCVYLAYSLVYISALLSSFITFLYSIEWGKEKSLSWLSSILMSICESVIVIQPFKIIIVAMLLSIILKRPDIEEETETSEESQMTNQVLPDEELLYKNPVKSERPALKIEPPDKEKLAEAREKRMKEIAMFDIVREIAFYFVFVALIVLVASHNRDKKAYNVKEAIDNIIDIKKINNRNHVPDFWKWLLEILLPRLYISKQWNNIPVDDTEKRMIATRVAYRVGPVRIRQQRVRQEECKAVPMMYKFVESCSQEWSVTMEDDATYLEGWTAPVVKNSTMLINYPWKHRSLFDDAGLPFSGEFGVYTGGGYVADLIGDRDRAMKIAYGLMLNNWINQYTRAIFIEFTVYNPYVNMFSNVFIAFEMPTMGKMLIKESVKTFRLFSYLGGYGVFVVLCELATLAIVIYFIVREVKVIRQQRKKYFKSFWNCLELFNMICAVVSVVMYIVRHMITQLAMQSVKKLRDKFYNFRKVAMWDEVFGYFMAFTIFVSIIKLLHLFRFNKRMSMIAGTLKYSTKELSAFSVVITILIVAFASWGYIMFGPKMPEYRNMFQSFETLLAFSLGDFDYLALERVNRVFGPIYFFTFILCIMIILLNVFVTILNESIAAVKSDVSKQSNEHEIVAFIWCRFKDWVGIDFDKIFAEVKRKYMLDGSDGSKDKEKAEDIEERLRDISKRLEKLGSFNTAKTHHPPPDMRPMDDTTKELLFTRLFPTVRHNAISLH